MKSAGYDVREEDPFTDKMDIALSLRERSPYVNRIKLMWQQMREQVIADFYDRKKFQAFVPSIMQEYRISRWEPIGQL